MASSRISSKAIRLARKVKVLNQNSSQKSNPHNSHQNSSRLSKAMMQRHRKISHRVRLNSSNSKNNKSNNKRLSKHKKLKTRKKPSSKRLFLNPGLMLTLNKVSSWIIYYAKYKMIPLCYYVARWRLNIKNVVMINHQPELSKNGKAVVMPVFNNVQPSLGFH